MGYDLHITRRLHWYEEGNDITSEEWLSLIARDSELQLQPENGPFFIIWNGQSSLESPWLNWSNGQIYTKNPDDALIDKMVIIAHKLGAKVQGDDGEIYNSHLDAHRISNKSLILSDRHAYLKIVGIIALFCISVFLGFSMSFEYLNVIPSVIIGIGFASVITLIWIFAWISQRKIAMRKIMLPYSITGEILTHDQMKQKYHLTIENYQPIHLDSKNVPEQFHDLIPLAEKWGIEDDVIRDDFENKVSDEEKLFFKQTLYGRTKAINHWIDSFGRGKMTDEAGAFLFMLEALEELRVQELR